MRQRAEDRRFVAVDVNDPDLPLLKDAGQLSGSRQQMPITIWQDNRFDPLFTRLGSQLAVVEQKEQDGYSPCSKSAQSTEYVALNTTEQLTDRTYGNAQK